MKKVKKYSNISTKTKKKMKQKIDDNGHLSETVSPFDSIGKSAAIDRTSSDFDNTNEKVKKIKILIYTGEYDADIAWYILGMLQLKFQGMLGRIDTIEQPAHISYNDKETIDFQLLLDQNIYTNLNSLRICFPIKF